MLLAAQGVRGRCPAGRRAAGWPFRVAPLLLLASGPAACEGAPRLAVTGQEGQLSPVLPGTCAVFLRIENAGDGDDSLVGARVDVPGAVAEIHGTVDGRMVKEDRVRIPARGAVQMRPGGRHIMVFRLPKDAGAGYQFTLRLAFRTTGEKAVTVTIAG